jgi:antitoxin (DNA-binding transcriptional repressor) of toxin-antitoxin stability system
MDQVAKNGVPIVITKRGHSVAQLAPVVEKPNNLLGFAKGKIRILGDIISPIDAEWNAAK